MLSTRFWKKYFSVYDVLNEVRPYKNLLQTIVEELSPEQGEKILDAGSGTGNLSVLLKKKGVIVTALDYSEEGVSRHKQKDSDVDVKVHDLTMRLPFLDSYFDKIVTNNTLYTIPVERRHSVITEFYRVLKPGGIIVISNIAKNFKPLAIYLKHMKEEYEDYGLLKTVRRLFGFAIPTIRMFYYNTLIKKENVHGNYDFLTSTEQENLLKDAGFNKIILSKKVYADQGVLTVARKI